MQWLADDCPGATFEELLEQSSLGQAMKVHEDDGERTANPRVTWRHDEDHAYLMNVDLIGRVGNVELFTIHGSERLIGPRGAPFLLNSAFSYDLKAPTRHPTIEAAKERAERDLTRYLSALGVIFKEEQ